MVMNLGRILPVNLSLKSRFSTISAVSREWKTIEARRIAKVHLPEVGAKIPKHLYVPKEKPEFPDYKYGESHIYKKSNKGLYGGSFIQFGNQISEKSKLKTRRSWKPNVITKGLWSEALNRKVNIKLTTSVLRIISKEGGIDNYLTKDKPARIKELGPTGWKLRFRVLMKGVEPKKNYLKLIEVENGQKIPVYAAVDGKNITVGKRKLLSALYGFHLENNSEESFKEFMSKHRDLPVDGIVEQLNKFHYDFSTVTV